LRKGEKDRGKNAAIRKKGRSKEPLVTVWNAVSCVYQKRYPQKTDYISYNGDKGAAAAVGKHDRPVCKGKGKSKRSR
jgi:hypothetical protein